MILPGGADAQEAGHARVELGPGDVQRQEHLHHLGEGALGQVGDAQGLVGQAELHDRAQVSLQPG